MTFADKQKLLVRAAVNAWIGRSFPVERAHLYHETPQYCPNSEAWTVGLTARPAGCSPQMLGRILVSDNGTILAAPDPGEVLKLLNTLEEPAEQPQPGPSLSVVEDGCEFYLADGIKAADQMKTRSVNLLLTDPPYGISRRYNCEAQIPRRIRKNGTDFTMPRGFFGDWDRPTNPRAWTERVLPKVAGWAVIFCAQAQIGEYCDILAEHKFVAVGPMVWHKTNPVPFNHKHKPINAWEALVAGKRPGAAFNGKMVHNVFLCESPSPRQRIHPTQKPLRLIAGLVELFSNPGDLVFDPFAGSATTVIAARDLRRRVVACEKDPGIYRLAADRITGKRSKLSKAGPAEPRQTRRQGVLPLRPCPDLPSSGREHAQMALPGPVR